MASSAVANEARIDYQAEPTARRFHASNAFVRGLMGPVGSGKTVTCIMETIRIGSLQAPMPDATNPHGVRRTRWAVIRNTYRELKTTTIKSMQDWLPPEVCTFRLGGADLDALLRLPGADGKPGIEIEYIFISLDRPEDCAKLLSLELTGVWISEAREVPVEVLEMATARVGRYPAEKDGGATRNCIIMETNPPDTDHWWFELAEVTKPSGYEFFKQPGALIRIDRGAANEPLYLPNPKAENIRHLHEGYGYYFKQIPAKRRVWIDAYILGVYSSISTGRACYPEYVDARHCSEKPLQPMKGLALRLGWDYGRTPACIIGQLTPNGQLRILRELVVDASGPGMALRTFVEKTVAPYLKTHFEGFEIISHGDPSGAAGGQAEENSCEDVLAELGIPTQSASTNDIESRLDNVVYFLGRNVDAGEPALLIDGANCPILRQGFIGKYEMARVQVGIAGGAAIYKREPVKNQYSHPHDGCQYLADGARHLKVQHKAAARPLAPPKRYGT
jgi:hypothetical protein